jgi:hypothetical protein
VRKPSKRASTIAKAMSQTSVATATAMLAPNTP